MMVRGAAVLKMRLTTVSTPSADKRSGPPHKNVWDPKGETSVFLDLGSQRTLPRETFHNKHVSADGLGICVKCPERFVR